MRKERFESELSRHLGPVKAPDQLWDRLQGAGAGQSRISVRTPFWTRSWTWVAAAAAVAGLAIGVNLMRNRNLSLEELAVSTLGREQAWTFPCPRRSRLRCNWPARRW
jgi:hypothetical protein